MVMVMEQGLDSAAQRLIIATGLLEIRRAALGSWQSQRLGEDLFLRRVMCVFHKLPIGL
jgi:hypothetical protein